MNKQTGTKTRPTLADRVYFTLKSRIAGGEYAPNEKLPSEHQLSQDLSASRPILRLALERLRDEGMIYSRQGAGSFVRPAATTPLGYAKVETLADIQRCYEFRLTIETAAAPLAAERHDAEALGEIEEALELLRAATGSMQHREDADFAFHVAITRASNNHYYEATMRALREHINVGMKLHGESLMTDGAKGLEDVLKEHTAIYEAVRARHADEAAELMQRHLEHSRDRLFGGGLLDLRRSR